MTEIKVPPNPTIPEDIQINLWGFEKTVAEKIGEMAAAATQEYSRYIPLESLDGITIAADYKEALAKLDRGFSCNIENYLPTEDQALGVGVAMALPVFRNEQWKTHIVFGPAIASMLYVKDETTIRNALGLLAHELGHVVDHHFKTRAFGTILGKNADELIPNPLDRFLWELSHHIWNEYCASRIASILTNHVSHESELFIDVCNSYKEIIRNARVQYNIGLLPFEGFLADLKHNTYLALMATAYLMGLNDGQEDGKDLTPEATKLLSDPEHADLLAYREILRNLWNNRGEWKSYDDFLALNKPTQDLLAGLEIYPSLMQDGNLFIEIPPLF